MREFVTAKTMADLDQETMVKLGLSSFQLMDSVADEMAKVFLRDARLVGSVLILCGSGNNGGDGYRLAEKLREAGREVRALEVLSPKSEDCKKARKLFKGEVVREISGDVDVVVDAIFGVNGRGDLPSAVVSVLKRIRRLQAFRVSLDVPTGVDSVSGRVHEDCFQADVTYVVAYPKLVFMQELVLESLGEIVFVGRDFAKPRGSKIFAIEDADFSVPIKKRTGHKALYGRCGIIGGSSKTPGAALLAAEAAHRVGAGYVSLYFAKDEGLKLKVTEASFLFRMKWKWSDLKDESAFVIGCGGVPKRIRWDLLTKFGAPMVIDADALAAFKGIPNGDGGKGLAILTPHPGEAARMLGTSVAEIQKDRLGALDELERTRGQSIYLKGAPGLLKFSSLQSQNYVNLYSNPVFAKAGSGDVLSGILGGFLAQAHPRKGSEQMARRGDGGNGDGGSQNMGSEQFRTAVISALVFQKKVGEVLRSREAAIATDHLNVFSEAFRLLRHQKISESPLTP